MSRVLVVTPDYASHYYPIGEVGRSLARRGHDVVVATGKALADQVESDGMSHLNLRLGPGSNNGVVDLASQTEAERNQMEGFFEATRLGMIPALLHQAENRLNDLLWEPEKVRRSLETILDVVDPHITLVDHLAFGATAALRSLGARFVTFHPGHPSVLSPHVPYGVPARIPSRITAGPEELAELHRVCSEVSSRFAEAYGQAAGDPIAGPGYPYSTPGPHGLIVNYPSSMGMRYDLPVSARFVGSTVRPMTTAGVEPEPTGRPRILVSLGTFFSARSDILRELVTAFRNEPVEVLLAHGATSPSELGPIPEGWTVEPFLPQPRLLGSCDLVVTHGGNNTVTEALTAGVPLLVGPLSTDQFSAAADIEDDTLGAVFDPNNDSSETIADLAHSILAGPAPLNASEMGRQLRARPGQEISADLVEHALSTTLAAA